MSGWLVLSRDVGQTIQVGPDIQIRVAQVRSRGKVRLAILAPESINVVRSELLTDEPLTDEQPTTADTATPQHDADI